MNERKRGSCHTQLDKWHQSKDIQTLHSALMIHEWASNNTHTHTHYSLLSMNFHNNPYSSINQFKYLSNLCSSYHSKNKWCRLLLSADYSIQIEERERERERGNSLYLSLMLLLLLMLIQLCTLNGQNAEEKPSDSLQVNLPVSVHRSVHVSHKLHGIINGTKNQITWGHGSC